MLYSKLLKELKLPDPDNTLKVFARGTGEAIGSMVRGIGHTAFLPIRGIEEGLKAMVGPSRITSSKGGDASNYVIYKKKQYKVYQNKKGTFIRVGGKRKYIE